MNLTHIYEEMLYENHKRRYGCVMGILPISKDGWSELLEKIDPEDLYGKDGDYGRELEPHVTLLFGFPNLPDKLIEKKIEDFTAPTVSMSNITSFNLSKYDILKFDVNGPELKGMHDELSKLPNHDKLPTYNPHVTIAYLKKGTAKKYVGKLSQPFTATLKEIKYSKQDGTEKIYRIA